MTAEREQREQRTPTPRSRDERRRAKEEINRQFILDAAETVFSERGLHEATMREIAAQADFSSGALYRFFESKDDILVQVMERKGRRLVEELEQAISGDLSAAEQMRRLAARQISYYAANREFYRLILRTAGPSWWTLKLEFDDRGAERFNRALDIETAMFRAGIESGDFIGDDPEQMAVVFIAILQAYLTRWLLHDESDELLSGPIRDQLDGLLERAFIRPRRASRGRSQPDPA